MKRRYRTHGAIVAAQGLAADAAEALKTATVEIVVQINGKVRDKLTVPSEITVPALEKLAAGQERIQGLIEGKTVVKVIAVPGKLVNIVVK